jgi:hypothetical protein
MLYASPWELPSAVATLYIIILLSAGISTSTRCTVASVAMSTGRPDRTSSATFERLSENFETQLRTALRDKHFPPQEGNNSLWIFFVLNSFTHKETHNRTLLFGSITLKDGRHFDYWKASEHAHTLLIPRVSWSWTLLLTSDTHRKPITSITAVLFLFVTYLLTLPYIYLFEMAVFNQTYVKQLNKFFYGTHACPGFCKNNQQWSADEQWIPFPR